MPVLSLSSCVLCMHPTQDPVHPVLGGPTCNRCLRRCGYDAANTRQVGSSDGEPAFSIEFEVCACASSPTFLEQATVLLRYAYLRTEDSSVDDEYKSPQYRDLTSFQEVLPTLAPLAPLVDSCCGTHIHVDCSVKYQVMASYHSLFVPLIHHCSEHIQETVEFWGRSFREGINTGTRYRTIEFRAPRFRSETQYLAVLCYCRSVVAFLEQHLTPNRPSAETISPQQMGRDILSMYQRALVDFKQRSEAYV